MEPKAATKVTLDQLDRKIINELQTDGRRPYTEIAKRLGVSEATVRKRVVCSP
jgi:Lrp/AsnC family transcriptional regulator for asnA, asnC and gidA